MSFLDRMPERAREFMAVNAIACPWDDVVGYSELPVDDHGWFNDDCRDGMQKFVDALTTSAGLPGDRGPPKPRCAVELGSWLGRGTIWMSEQFEWVIAVDHWRGSEEHHRDRDDTRDRLPRLFPQFLRNVEAAGRTNVVPVRMETWEAKNQLRWPCDQIDLVFVDASHDYESVWQDVFEYHYLLSPRGMICGDDYELDSVKRAVHDVAKNLIMNVIGCGTFWMLTPDVDGRVEATDKPMVVL